MGKGLQVQSMDSSHVALVSLLLRESAFFCSRLWARPSDVMVLEAHLQQAVLLKKVVDAMKDLCKDVNFDCSEKGLQVQSMDSSHVALVSLLLRESAFSDFKCD